MEWVVSIIILGVLWFATFAAASNIRDGFDLFLAAGFGSIAAPLTWQFVFAVIGALA